MAAGDVNGDGLADVIVGAGAGAAGGHVKAFGGADRRLLRSFFAYDGFNGGVLVGAATSTATAPTRSSAGADAGGGRTSRRSAQRRGGMSFLAYDPAFTGGVRVGRSGPAHGRQNVVTGNGRGPAATSRRSAPTQACSPASSPPAATRRRLRRMTCGRAAPGTVAPAPPSSATRPPQRVLMTEPPIQCSVDDGFAQWLTTAARQPGPHHLPGRQGRARRLATAGRSRVLPRQFDKPMGLAVPTGRRLAAGHPARVVLLRRRPAAGPRLPGRPARPLRRLLPAARSYYTGDLNVHDVAFGGDGPVDRQHPLLLPGPAERRLQLRAALEAAVRLRHCARRTAAISTAWPWSTAGRSYVTCLGETDTAGGWRPNKATGGVVIDVRQRRGLLRGLSMPHSPRWHDGRLWVLNSGAGELLALDPKDGRHVVVCALPGYLRGLSFAGPYALVGLCQIRERHIFGGLPVQQRFAKLLCGVALIDLRDGRTAGTARVHLRLPGDVRRAVPAGGAPADDAQPAEGRRAPGVPAPEFSYWLRPAPD